MPVVQDQDQEQHQDQDQDTDQDENQDQEPAPVWEKHRILRKIRFRDFGPRGSLCT